MMRRCSSTPCSTSTRPLRPAPLLFSGASAREHLLETLRRPRDENELMASRLAGFGAAAQLFPGTAAQQEYIAELRAMLAELPASLSLRGAADGTLLDEAAAYLFAELTDPESESREHAFVASEAAAHLARDFREHLHNHGADERFSKALDSVRSDPESAFGLPRTGPALTSVQRPTKQRTSDESPKAILLGLQTLDRGATVLMKQPRCNLRTISRPSGSHRAAITVRDLQNLVGSHPFSGEGGAYRLEFNRFLSRLCRFDEQIVPAFKKYHEVKSDVVERRGEDMRLTEFQPARADFVRPEQADRLGLPAAHRRQPRQADWLRRRRQADRPPGAAAPHLAAGLRKNDADGVHRQSAGDHLHEDQRARDRSRGDLARSRSRHRMPAPGKRSRSSISRSKWATT